MVVLIVAAALAAPITLEVERADVAALDAIYLRGRDWVWVQGGRRTVKIEHWSGGRAPYLEGVTVVSFSRDGSSRRVRYFEGADRSSSRLVRGGVTFRTAYRAGRDSYSRRETESYDGAPPLSPWALLAALPEATAPAGSTWSGTFIEDDDVYAVDLTWAEHEGGAWVHLDTDLRSGWLVGDGGVTGFVLGSRRHDLASAEERAQLLERMAAQR